MKKELRGVSNSFRVLYSVKTSRSFSFQLSAKKNNSPGNSPSRVRRIKTKIQGILLNGFLFANVLLGFQNPVKAKSLTNNPSAKLSFGAVDNFQETENNSAVISSSLTLQPNCERKAPSIYDAMYQNIISSRGKKDKSNGGKQKLSSGDLLIRIQLMAKRREEKIKNQIFNFQLFSLLQKNNESLITDPNFRANLRSQTQLKTLNMRKDKQIVKAIRREKSHEELYRRYFLLQKYFVLYKEVGELILDIISQNYCCHPMLPSIKSTWNSGIFSKNIAVFKDRVSPYKPRVGEAFFIPDKSSNQLTDPNEQNKNKQILSQQKKSVFNKLILQLEYAKSWIQKNPRFSSSIILVPVFSILAFSNKETISNIYRAGNDFGIKVFGEMLKFLSNFEDVFNQYEDKFMYTFKNLIDPDLPNTFGSRLLEKKRLQKYAAKFADGNFNDLFDKNFSYIQDFKDLFSTDIPKEIFELKKVEDIFKNFKPSQDSQEGV